MSLAPCEGWTAGNRKPAELGDGMWQDNGMAHKRTPLRFTVRMMGVSLNTATKLLVDMVALLPEPKSAKRGPYKKRVSN